MSPKNIICIYKKYISHQQKYILYLRTIYFIFIKNIFYSNQYPFTLPRSELSLRLSCWQIPTKMVFVIKNILRYVSFTHLSIISKTLWKLFTTGDAEGGNRPGSAETVRPPLWAARYLRPGPGGRPRQARGEEDRGLQQVEAQDCPARGHGPRHSAQAGIRG